MTLSHRCEPRAPLRPVFCRFDDHNEWSFLNLPRHCIPPALLFPVILERRREHSPDNRRCRIRYSGGSTVRLMHHWAPYHGRQVARNREAAKERAPSGSPPLESSQAVMFECEAPNSSEPRMCVGDRPASEQRSDGAARPRGHPPFLAPADVLPASEGLSCVRAGERMIGSTQLQQLTWAGETRRGDMD